jgi:hypothetical protein
MSLVLNLSEYRFVLEYRLKCCIARYKGIEEYMEIPNMDLWLNLKEEIINNKIIKEKEKEKEKEIDIKIEYDYEEDYDNYSMDSIDREEFRRNRFIDKCLSDRYDRYD